MRALGLVTLPVSTLLLDRVGMVLVPVESLGQRVLASLAGFCLELVFHLCP